MGDLSPIPVLKLFQNIFRVTNCHAALLKTTATRIIMYIYRALVNALSTHIIHINLNMIFCTVLSETIYIKCYVETHSQTQQTSRRILCFEVFRIKHKTKVKVKKGKTFETKKQGFSSYLIPYRNSSHFGCKATLAKRAEASSLWGLVVAVEYTGDLRPVPVFRWL